jgi:hypothetical protein
MLQRSVNTVVVPQMFATEPVAVLREVFELLQDYAPIWYTEELHNRMAAALGESDFEPTL